MTRVRVNFTLSLQPWAVRGLWALHYPKRPFRQRPAMALVRREAEKAATLVLRGVVTA